jgi:protease-4
MWSWFLARLKGILNFFASIVIFFALLLAIVFIFGALQPEGSGVPKVAVLELDLRGVVTDSPSNNPFDARHNSVLEIVAALAQAETDDNIKGAFLRVGGGQISAAHVEEVRDAIKSFRAKKKSVTAFAHGFNSNGISEYYLASAVDEIWLQPVSELGTAGIAAQSMFFKRLLDKIEAKAEIGQRYEFKNAGAPFISDDYTPAHREATVRLIKSIFENATTAIAADRKMTTEQYVALVNSGPHLTQAALDAKLIDKQGYDDEAQKSALDRAGKDAKLISIGDYLEKAGNPWISPFGRKSAIALIEGEGTINDGSSAPGGFGNDRSIDSDTFAEAIRDATEDDDIKVILFRVNSPGGSATASDQILQALRKTQRGGKKVVISMGNVAASGGYYVSLAADKIFAQPSTITGSIGVLSGKLVIGKTLASIGIDVREISEGVNASMNSEVQGYTEAQRAKLEASLDAIYNDFTAKVAEGRKIPLETVREIAKGRVWTGADAKERGLVDVLGGFRAALQEAKKLAGLKPEDDVNLKRFPGELTPWEAIAKAYGTSASVVRTLAFMSEIFESSDVKEAVKILREDSGATAPRLMAPRQKVQ